jgi:hypothetical protein
MTNEIRSRKDLAEIIAQELVYLYLVNFRKLDKVALNLLMDEKFEQLRSADAADIDAQCAYLDWRDRARVHAYLQSLRVLPPLPDRDE